MSMAPSSSIGTTQSLAPVASRTCCQGTMFEWCSSSVITISSPGPSSLRAQAWATRLMASVVPRVQMISSLWRAARNARTRSRAVSKASVARWLSACTPRWTLALLVRSCSATASITALGLCVVAALSRYTSG